MYEHEHPLNLIDLWSEQLQHEEEYDEEDEEDGLIAKQDFRCLCYRCKEEITWFDRCDKHPMKLSYFPIENHKSDYFCEICEKELNPQLAFYHCYECMQSIHTVCAPSILCYETHMGDSSGFTTIYEFANVKFGSTYNNTSIHPHPLSFVQGIATNGRCTKCHERLQYKMIFKCLDCEFAICYDCLECIV
ncbi:hypothetical protein E3N88_39580 [Mikania micrantha]|uniref:DC1 domain-containing protein n=1 Tax=Mikania micrantha TaxID=192012 RepID=A0A5N6LX66_9ASTR|nr:hypothetical protein E3N88_39580 [Mikania micrantha]